MIKKNKLSYLILIGLTLIGLFLHLFKFHASPPGFNADEAAYGYNAYSIIKTGADEFGNKFPLLRIKSFGDYKLPLYTYLTIPFIQLLGLTETAVRLPNLIAALLLIWSVYFLTKELFERERISLLAAFFITLSPWANILSRHAHEVVTATFFLTTGFTFLIRFVKKKNNLVDGLLFAFFICLALYTYHISRLFYIFFFGIFLFYSYRRRIALSKVVIILVTAFILTLPFVYAEFKTPPTRLGHLFIANNPGIELKSIELKTELGRSPFGTKLFITTDEIMRRYLTYFSPEFLIFKGDTNNRFGFDGMGPVNIVEYFLYFVGLFFLFKGKPKQAGMLLALLLISPLPAALTWQEYALTRAYYMIIPFTLFVAYGADKLLEQRIPYKTLVTLGITGTFLVLTVRTWTFFFYHYPRRATTVRSWQAGYKELAAVIEKNYDKYDRFNISSAAGQPYIFMLFYLKYPPAKFQKVVQTTQPDEYGYTQVIGFDKFLFNVDHYNETKDNKKILYIFSQTEGRNYEIHEDQVDKIKIETEEMYWVKIR